MTDILEPQETGLFPEGERQAIYDVIRLRRDVRHFQPQQTIPDDVFQRIMGAAHMAPSVGFSQLWGFILIRDRSIREQIRTNFLRCREAESVRFPPKRREEYMSHRLEGILEATLNVCVVVDLRAQGEAVLGTMVQPEAVRASACCAVKISRSPRVPKASEWGGSASSNRRSCEPFSRCHLEWSRWPTSVWGHRLLFDQSRCSRRRGGARAVLLPTSSTR